MGSERNTRIRASQIISITPNDIESDNEIQDNYYIRKKTGENKFEWVAGGGVSNLYELSDVDFDSGTPSDNQVLTYDNASGKWKAEDPTGGASQLSDLTDVGVTTPTDKNVLVADGDSWESRALVEADISDLTHYTSDDFNTDFGNKDLDDLADGTTYKKLKVDNFTIKENNNIIKIADRIENNIFLNAFRLAVQGSLTIFNMVDGFLDEYEDESGIDTDSSENEDYDSVNDLYQPLTTENLELDYMEYSTDELAQDAWESSDPDSGGGIDSDTKLMLHCNGTDESTSFPDDSDSNHTVTANGTAQVDTAIKKWGTGSLMLDGNSDYLQLPDSSDWDIFASNADNWTIDFWVKHADHSGIEFYITQFVNSSNRWYIYHYDDGGNGGFVFELQVSGSLIQIVASNTEITDSNWHHIALCKVADEYGIYKDGTQIGYTQDSSTANLTADLYIGAMGGSDFYFNGHMDEIRIQHSNIFSASPNSTPDDTISVPTGEYSEEVAGSLTVSSEDTIKNQGTYSLKVIADITDSLNETITKTLTTGNHLDLSSYSEIKLDIYASRTGTNLQIKIHDSGGTTSTYNITVSEANTWETKSWDISGISSANKDDIDSIIVEVTNADAENIVYLDNIYAKGETNNMTLISESVSAEMDASNSRIVIFEEDVDSITLNTDLLAYISKDDGNTWGQVTLANEGTYEGSKRILSGIVDLTQSGIDSGSSYPMRYKIITLNNKDLKIHGTGVEWD